ncbi:M50 family metallopeptidase [Geobacillus sp. C56-T3]|uniref:M50 family metallopeptidase n=1 Tax=Geobacillus sp. (strain C56-T3) TaxID=691437 RepID=UPI0001D58207|nr:M50 family metallopeptidase [Geobacillus sp. C56-T3]ADI25419.1 peptidase M50 [Geobacillus sp. C56-T3]
MYLKIKDSLQFYKLDNGIYHVYDPTSMKHFRIGEQEVKWLKLLNGENSEEFLKKHIPEEFFEKFINQVKQLGLLEGQKVKKKFDLFKIKFTVLSVNDLLNKLGKFSYIFRKFLKYFSGIFLFINFIFIALNFNNIRDILNNFHFDLSIIFFYLISVLTIGFLHEFSHALVAKSYGVNVPNIGMMLFYLHPAFYADISGINLLSNKKARVSTLLSGILINNILLSMSVLSYHFLKDNHPNLSLYIIYFSIINLIMIFINIIPFVEFDGYYILINLFDEINFKYNSIIQFKTFMKLKSLRGIKLEYLLYYVISNMMGLSMIWLAIIAIKNYVSDIFQFIYLDYFFILLIILVTIYFYYIRNRRIT